MCIMRALCGIGGGLMIPNIVALLGITFPPGKKRNLGMALFGALEVNTFDNGKNLLKGYHSAAYLAVGLATASLILSVVFIRIPKDTREGWGEDEAKVEMR